MQVVLLDGSNVSLHASGRGRLTSLEGLSRVVNCLLLNRIVPYTVFDASFRYRTAEQSAARSTFDHLTRNMKEYFQMSPRGEEADLFLLEMAAATGHPIISNDTYQKYGGVRDGLLPYKGAKISVFNFQVFAGTVVIPDLEIRHRVRLEDDSLDDVRLAFAAAAEHAEEAPQEEGGPQPDPAAQAPSPTGQSAEVGPTTLKAIEKVIGRYVNGGVKPLDGLGKRLADYKRKYLLEAHLGKRSKKVWFGFATLRAFIESNFLNYRLGENSIQERGSEEA